MVLFFKHCISPFILPNTGIIALSLCTLVFSSYSSKYWDSGLICLSIGIMMLIFQTLECCPIFLNIEILNLSFQTLEFWPFFIHIGSVIRSFQTLEFSSHPLKRWNSGPIFINILILTLSFQRWEFLFYASTANIGILALFLYTLELKSYSSNNGILSLFL